MPELAAPSSTGLHVPSAVLSAITDANPLLERVLKNPLLPSPPTLALKIVEQVSDPECDMNKICAQLAKDPAVCAKLLKVVNSVRYAPSQPVTLIKHAVMILGFNPLRSLVLGLTLPTMQFNGQLGVGLQKHWKQSVIGATIARELADLLKYPSPEADFVAGLLRDLGMILLKQTFPDKYEPLWSGAKVVDFDEQCAWEEAEVGIDHATVSAGLLRLWRLPDELADPIRYHHHPENMPAAGPLLVKRTHLLNFTSRLAALTEAQSNKEALQETLRMARDEFSLEQEELETFLANVVPKIEECAALLQVDIGNCPDLAAVLSAGCEELVRLSVESAAMASNAALLTPQADGSQASRQSTRFLTEIAAGAAGDGHGSLSSTLGSGIYAPDTADFVERLGRPGGESRIRHYQIQQILGRGAMGIVYKALDVQLNRLVALKILVPDKVSSTQARQRFAREARAAAAVTHENVVSIFAVEEVRGVPFLVMEFVPGRSLQDWLDAGRAFTIPEVVSFGRQVALGLAAAHKLRVVHRDIKPANVLVQEDTERVRIADFGLARTLDEDVSLTQDGVIVGTPPYMSPEQVCGRPLDASSDVFSFGSVLYALCTRQRPFGGESYLDVLNSVRLAETRPVRELNPAVPMWLATLIRELHSKDPAQRPTAAAAAEVLDNSV